MGVQGSGEVRGGCWLLGNWRSQEKLLQVVFGGSMLYNISSLHTKFEVKIHFEQEVMKQGSGWDPTLWQ